MLSNVVPELQSHFGRNVNSSQIAKDVGVKSPTRLIRAGCGFCVLCIRTSRKSILYQSIRHAYRSLFLTASTSKIVVAAGHVDTVEGLYRSFFLEIISQNNAVKRHRL